MNIEKMTVEELKAAAAECDRMKCAARKGEKFRVVVLTNGFIYVGWFRRGKLRAYLRDAKNVRYFAGNGLGPCALDGPPPNSKIDRCGDLEIERHALLHTMSANPDKWP